MSLMLSSPAKAQQEQEAGSNPSEEVRKLSEGLVLHKEDGSLYYYRILTDSTVLIRPGAGESAGPMIALPASVVGAIHGRVEEHILTDAPQNERLAIGYEDQQVILRLVRRMDLTLLAGLLSSTLALAILSVWLGRRFLKERRHRAASEAARYYLAEGREKERQRIAREIHDGPVQDLHGLHMQLFAAGHNGNGKDIEQAGEELMRIARELRAVSADLRPPALDRFGLAAALRSFADRFREQHPGVQVELNLEKDGEELPEAVRLALFRVAQEAMNNAVQHASAGCIAVGLVMGEETAHLTVEDDGQGFDTVHGFKELAEAGHFGLVGMVERAKAAGGGLAVDSAPGAGTRVRVEVPREAVRSRKSTSRRRGAQPKKGPLMRGAMRRAIGLGPGHA